MMVTSHMVAIDIRFATTFCFCQNIKTNAVMTVLKYSLKNSVFYVNIKSYLKMLGF